MKKFDSIDFLRPEVIHNDPNLSRVKPVQNPSAQYVKLCQVREDLDMIHSRIKSVIEFNKDINDLDKFVICVMYEYGLRISEVLRISHYDILRDYKVLVKGSKRSQNRIISLKFISEYADYIKRHHIVISDVRSRHYYYRLFKRYGLSHCFGQRKKNSVTHLFRHMFVKELRANDIAYEDIGNYMGHVNKKNTEYYGK